MVKKYLVLPAIAFQTWLMMAGFCQASVAYDWSLPGVTHGATVQGQDVGYEFTVLNDVDVASLMVWDEGGDDFITGDADVTIWNASNQSVVVTALVGQGERVVPSAPGSGVWRAVDIAPTTLTAGKVYRIAADGFGTGDDLWAQNTDGFGSLIDPNISIASTTDIYYAGSFGNGPDYPATVGNNFQAIYGAASFEIVPEPTTAALAGFGLAGLSVAIRRRR